jgi:DNA polymerase III subunit epsilon
MAGADRLTGAAGAASYSAMREVVLDTETTGFSPEGGDRIIEVGAVELANHVPTGRTFQCYINPERPVPVEAFAVHGLSDAFLADKPLFADIADGLMDFLGDARLVIHNADFDVGFLNAELDRIERPRLERARVIDTLAIARKKFFGAGASLDALCRRFEVDLTDRALHGALKDALLLAEVYLGLLGGRQPGLELTQIRKLAGPGRRSDRTPLLLQPTAAEAAAHAALLDRLTNPIWRASAPAQPSSGKPS